MTNRVVASTKDNYELRFYNIEYVVLVLVVTISYKAFIVVALVMMRTRIRLVVCTRSPSMSRLFRFPSFLH